MTTVTIATLKGGQGKTFLSALLCRALASDNKRVLAISLCSQNDINLFLNGSVGDNQLFEAFKNNDIRSSIIETKFENIDLVPYDIDSSESVDKLLQTLSAGETRLKGLLNQVRDQYDYAILDTGPNLGSSTIAAIIASDYLLSPVFMSWSAINGFIATGNAVDDMLNLELTKCKHLGIIRACNNVNKDRELFEVEEYLEKNKLTELGVMPKSSALKAALYNQTDYKEVKSHHLKEIEKLLTNIKNQIA